MVHGVPTLRTQNGCWNCGHVFRCVEYDAGDVLYCNITDDRPPCPSVLMDELPSPAGKGKQDWIAGHRVWDKWVGIHDEWKCRKPAMICDNWCKETA